MNNISNTTKYTELADAVKTIKNAILQSQQRALATINQEQLALYYGLRGFSSSNLKKMRTFYEEWKQD